MSNWICAAAIVSGLWLAPRSSSAGEAPTTRPAEDGLVALYPLDGDARDHSGHGRDGNVVGAVGCEDRNDAADGAMEFDGRSEIVLPAPKLPDNRVTISLWVRLDDPAGPSQFVDFMDGGGEWRDAIIGQNDGYNIRAWQLWMAKEGRFVWHRMADYSSVWTKWSAEPALWYHVAVTFDGERHTLYVNGKPEHQADGIFRSFPDEPVRLGAIGDGGSGKRVHLTGALDDVRIYDRALPADQIASMAGSKQQGSEP